MKKIFCIAFSVLMIVTVFESCNLRGKKTILHIEDNNRHYYPIRRGKKRELIFKIKNAGKHPFIMSDIFTSCGCLVVSKKSSVKTIPAGKTGILRLNYLSTSNVGYAKYYITLYGNLDSLEKRNIEFDINIVPDAEYTKDYEEVYREVIDKYHLKEATGGDVDMKYYLDGDF